MRKLPNIYLCGKAGAGKSICAAFLRNFYEYQTAKFAYPVYHIAYDYFEMQGKDRKLLQVIGSDVGRTLISSDLWVNRFKEDMKIIEETRKTLNLKYCPFILDDCRFENEHKVLASMGWVGIYLDVSDEVRKSRLVGRDGTAQENTLQHPSELAVEKFSSELVQLDASGSAEDMYKRLVEIVMAHSREE